MSGGADQLNHHSQSVRNREGREGGREEVGGVDSSRRGGTFAS
jgi:hypothetical protein